MMSISEKVYADGMKRRWGAENFEKKCPECDRTFDILDPSETAEWYKGHDCEARQ